MNTKNPARCREKLDSDVAPSLARRVLDWRGGKRARVHVAEPVVMQLGFLLTDLPDEVWDCSQAWHLGPRKVAA